MATFANRLAEFISDQIPDDGSSVELLCEDHVGTYVIPFPCHRAADTWRNSQTDEIVEAEVVGWRPWERVIYVRA